MRACVREKDKRFLYIYIHTHTHRATTVGIHSSDRASKSNMTPHVPPIPASSSSSSSSRSILPGSVDHPSDGLNHSPHPHHEEEEEDDNLTTMTVSTDAPENTARPPLALHHQAKQGGKCCGCCCDYRRAVGILGAVLVCMSVMDLAVTARRVGTIHDYAPPPFDDDQLDNQLAALNETYRIPYIWMHTAAVLFGTISVASAWFFSQLGVSIVDCKGDASQSPSGAHYISFHSLSLSLFLYLRRTLHRAFHGLARNGL